MLSLLLLLAFAFIGFIALSIIHALFLHSLSRIPGPKTYALTKWRLAYEDLRERRTRTIHSLHERYGPVVRIGPKEVHFNSLSALRKIYGPGSGFGRTGFYRMFDVYGKQNVFTFGPVQDHAGRKKLLANAYSKSTVLKGDIVDEVESRAQDYLDLIAKFNKEGRQNNAFTTLHWYSLDNITNFLYGPEHGGTSAMKGVPTDLMLLDDILDPARRPLTWLRVHLPALTAWLYTRTGLVERLVRPFLPMQKPATYTGLRAHALHAMQKYKAAAAAGKLSPGSHHALIAKLWTHHQSLKENGLDDFDIASECADHFLAGIDTTSDTLMFLIWAISLPENRKYQQRIVEEAKSITSLNGAGNPTVEAGDRLPYLDAVIKEILRLYAPLPASELRSAPVPTEIDGYLIPAGTTVSMSPYSLHRNPAIFSDPLKWDPDRWLVNDSEELAQMKKWFWAFSSGGRMCIGIHLAMAEMVALVPAIYRKYETRIAQGFEGVSPGVTSRFEVFGDERFDRVEV
jgi:hypothetical protein